MLISFLSANLSLFTIFINSSLKKYSDYTFDLFIKVKNYILKKRTLVYIKIFFSFVTLYHCIHMSSNYLRYKYRYNLIVEDNSEGIEWKPIYICTESKVLFDKNKVIQYFDLSEIYSDLENKNNKAKFITPIIEYGKMINISKFFVSFVNTIFEEINFVELSSLIVNEKQLFECSAKFHYKNQSINSFALEEENCFEKFEIKITYIANKFLVFVMNFLKPFHRFFLKIMIS